jgi:hypothetical protein
MKPRTVIFLTVLATVSLAAWLHPRPVDEAEIAPHPSLEPEPAASVKEPEAEAPVAAPAKIVTKPEPIPKPEPIIIAQTDPPDHLVKPPPTPAEKQRSRMIKHWERQSKNFDRQIAQLSREKNPQRRLNLIRAMSYFVKTDTLAALDWAASLENPAEQRAAMEAINKNALTGIGATIALDETGYPKIKQTTILSALESTGMAEPGDYISGMVNEDGSVTSFKNMPIHQVVRLLRGKPGTVVNLVMESSGQSFDLSVERSLIVIEPPR